MIRVHVAQERNIKNVVERIIDTKNGFRPVTIECCFWCFYATFVDCADRIILERV